MKYDFDTPIDRRGSNSLKYDFAAERGMGAEVLPMWVADMDFQTAPEIIERLQQTVAHGIFGYSDSKEDYFQAVASWYARHFNWQVKPNWLIKTPGIVFAIATAIRAYTKEGEAVLIQQPVYYPFAETIADNKRVVVNNPLQLVNGHYEIDFKDFEDKIIENKVKLFLLCSPHNPVGRVWQEWELRKLGDICLRYGVTIVSDEIHSDFVNPGHQHHVLASLSPALADITITCTSPSKTFNLAGLQVSNIFIANQKLRRSFRAVVASNGYSQVNLLGLVACQAAYQKGEQWLVQVQEYLQQNLLLVKEFLQQKIPQIKLIEPEGTYLLWLDCRELGLDEQARTSLIVQQAKLWLDSGELFGVGGAGFERINIACPKVVVQQALQQLYQAVQNIDKK